MLARQLLQRRNLPCERPGVLRSGRHARSGLSTTTIRLGGISQALQRGAPIDVHPEVEHALQHRLPVVALESTIITHGMPPPTNLTTARSVESIVRSTGAVPATIGLISGRVKIGLTPCELERLADVEHNKGVVKLSRRDLGPAIAGKRDGGTTCSTTLMFAALARIKVFSTGGLGGVHRGGESSMDVSADLHELTRCPVGLVSAGVKSILDIGRTLEYLETLGVPVVTYGPTDDFPAFYSRKSGFKSPWRFDDPILAARILQTHHHMGMTTGALFAAPIPEEHEAIGQELQKSVEQAVRESEENGVSRRGKEATPWLLKRVGELTKGRSLQSNIALIENTARVGGDIAVAYARLVQEKPLSRTDTLHAGASTPAVSTPPMPSELAPLPAPKLMVIGSAAVDITAQSTLPSTTSAHSTSPGGVSLSLGGVGRNVAEAAHRMLSSTSGLRDPVQLVSAVGDDAFGRLLKEEMGRMGMRLDGLIEAGTSTAVCNLVLDAEGALIGGVADMGIVEQLGGPKIAKLIEQSKPLLVAIDGNLLPETLNAVVQACVRTYTPVYFEPTSISKSTRILPAVASAIGIHTGQSPLALAAPNQVELVHLYRASQALADENPAYDAHVWETLDSFRLGTDWRTDVDLLARQPVSTRADDPSRLGFLVQDGVARMAVNLLPVFERLIVKLGAQGVLLAMRLSGEPVRLSGWARLRSDARRRLAVSRAGDEIIVLQHFPGLEVDGPVHSTGAGDTLLGTLLAEVVQDGEMWENPEKVAKAIDTAQRAACLTLSSKLAVAPRLSELR